MQQAADESSDYQRELWRNKTIEALEQAKAEGVTIHEVDQSLFAEKVKPMYDNLKDEKIIKLVKQIRQIEEQ